MNTTGIRKDLLPTEEAEQRALALWLDWHKILWCHVPNGGERSKAVAGKLKAAGVKAGVPDVLVFDPPRRCNRPGCTDHVVACPLDRVGVAIELKRRKPAASRVSVEQDAWANDLSERGWIVAICYGADEAIALLTELGYATKGRQP